MALEITLEQLEEVQAAISKVLSGQSVSIGGKQLTRASLQWLNDREKMLLARYHAEAGTGGPAVNEGLLAK